MGGEFCGIWDLFLFCLLRLVERKGGDFAALALACCSLFVFYGLFVVGL